MPTLNFKGKTVIETYRHTVAHHRLEFDAVAPAQSESAVGQFDMDNTWGNGTADERR